MRANSIRFTGMASGMDTDSIVKGLLAPQQYKIDNQKKAQALLQLKQDAWKDMNKKLFDFHTKFTDKMRLGGVFNKNTITSSNTNAIGIDSDTLVPQGTHTFDVTQLAESASVVGQVNSGKALPGDTKLSALVGDKFTIPSKLTMEINGEPITISVNADSTLAGIAEALNKELKGKSESEGGNKLDTGFTASYDEKNGGFFISSTATGEGQKIKFSSDNAEGAKLFQRMGFETGKEITGKDAKYIYNDSDIEFTSPTNKIEINGIKANLKAANLGKVTITSEPDKDVIYKWVKDFVTEYNTLIDEINLKIGTKPRMDIMPLTAEERESMSDSEIKIWEEKLSASLFYKDEQLTSFVNSARNILGQVLNVGEGKPNSLASLGIITGSWEERGKLHILGDEDDALYSGQTNKLKAAIEEDSSRVAEFLKELGGKLYEAHNKTFTSSNKLKSAMNFYNDKAIADKVKDFDKQISTLEERMYRMEDMQYAKFAAMEKMLSALNNQSSWLSQQFGGY